MILKLIALICSSVAYNSYARRSLLGGPHMLYYSPFHTHKDFAKSVYDEIAYGSRTLGIGEEVRKRVEVVVRTGRSFGAS